MRTESLDLSMSLLFGPLISLELSYFFLFGDRFKCQTWPGCHSIAGHHKRHGKGVARQELSMSNAAPGCRQLSGGFRFRHSGGTECPGRVHPLLVNSFPTRLTAREAGSAS